MYSIYNFDSISDDLLKKAQEVFADVQTEFWDVKKILSRFNEWRVSFQESYSNAYIGLCLPKLLAPLIRHQLIGWNPLQVIYGYFEVPSDHFVLHSNQLEMTKMCCI